MDGRDNGHGYRKWLHLALCFLVTFLGGTFYSYSVIGYELQRLWNLSTAEAGFPYFAALGAYGYLMIVGGVLDRKFGSEKIPLYLGSVLFGLGFVGASFVERNIVLFSILFFITGFGIALMDSTTLPIATSWMPERPGLAIGIARTGFGIASLLATPLFEYVIGRYGFNQGLRIVGVAYLFLAILLALLLKRNPRIDDGRGHSDIKGALLEILSRRCFWIIWIAYFTGLLIPLSYVGYIKQIGIELAKISSDLLVFLMALFALFNGLGRLIYGRIIDVKGFRYSATIAYLLTIIALALLWLYPSPYIFTASSIILYIHLGGWLVIAPTEVRRLSDPRNYPLGWPAIMTGYATAVFTGTALTGFIKDSFKSYTPLFPMAIALLTILGTASLYLFYRCRCLQQA
ncbi:MAG: MFS transporter [Ignisphaera sp.]